MTTRIQNAQEPFTETQSDSLGKRTRDDYEKETKKLEKWLNNITDYNSQALTEDGKLILQDITLDMLTTYLGDNKFYKKKYKDKEEGDMYSESHAWKIHSAIMALFENAKVPLPKDYEKVILYKST